MWRSIVLVVCLMPSASAQTVAEQYLLSAINQERTIHKLPPVRLDAALHRSAQEHAQSMADHRGISHQFPGEPELSARGATAGARFDRITENVAEGPTVLILHDAWMHSPGHRGNILDAEVDAVGIAVLSRDRQLYAVEDFAHTVAPATFEQQEGAIAALVERAGLTLLPNTDARASCALASGSAGDMQATFILRYTTADLTELPQRLKTHLAQGREHAASIGACAPRTHDPFTTYSLVVLLYP